MMIPQEIEVGWYLNFTDFNYAKFRITNIEYNNPSKY